jgi:hypothetical protein
MAGASWGRRSTYGITTFLGSIPNLPHKIMMSTFLEIFFAKCKEVTE